MPPREINTSHFANDIRDLLACLADHKVDFMLVGGEAVIFHGYPRVTGDVDIFYRLTDGNVARLFDALRVFWGGKVPGIKTPSSLGQEGLIIQFGVPPHRVDFINRIDGIGFAEAWRSCEQVVMAGDDRRTVFRIIGLEALIINKRASGRPKDLDDLRYLARKSRSKRKG